MGIDNPIAINVIVVAYELPPSIDFSSIRTWDRLATRTRLTTSNTRFGEILHRRRCCSDNKTLELITPSLGALTVTGINHTFGI